MLLLNRLARETVHPVQLAPLSQMIGGPPPAARAFSKFPRTDRFKPRTAAEPIQYFMKSRLLTSFMISSFRSSAKVTVFV